MASENKKNSFKELASQQGAGSPQPSPELEHNVMGIARSTTFMGNVFELYFSKAISMISVLFGATESMDEKMAGGTQSADDTEVPFGKAK